MSGNFEVLPCGTQARLAAVEAERDAFRKGFYAGFAATGEGWNGEYPFQDTNRRIAGDPDVEAALDAAIDAVKGGGNG